GALKFRLPLDHSLAEAANGPSMKVLMAVAELAPFAKAAGLAEAGAALAKQLQRPRHDVRLVMPRYRQVGLAGLTTVTDRLPEPPPARPAPCRRPRSEPRRLCSHDSQPGLPGGVRLRHAAPAAP